MASKSRSCYEELRNSGVLKLPSMRTLTDYKNYIRPKAGFRKQVIENLKEITADYFDVERYVVLMFDEMKIRSNLVFNKHNEELIGFVDLGDPVDVNFNCFKDQNELASYTLVFYLRGLSKNLKFSLGHFATNGISAYQLFPIFWEAVTILELSCNLWVIAATSDGASPNRRFFRLIAEEEGDCPVRYKAVNKVKPWRYIYLFSDGPHLMKTARNCLESLSRILWNDGDYLSWQHIVREYNRDLDDGLKSLPKLTQDHMNLSSYSKMTVRFAVQVLSESVSKVLKLSGDDQVKGTAKYCEMMDKFFDCVNVRSLKEGEHEIKPFLEPYKSLNDERFTWLKEEFLPYFTSWLKSINERPGEFTKQDKAKMFISRQTHEGLIMTSCR